MTATSNDHLTEDQLLQKLLDPSDLSDNCKAHLAACSSCRIAVDSLHADLHQVHTLALATSPKSVGQFRLPSAHTKSVFSIWAGMPLFPRLVASAIALFLVIGAALLIKPGQENISVYEAGYTVDPDQLLSEIDELVETPFAPEFLLTISATEMDIDEDFMKTIVPIIENDPMSRTWGKKGESLC